MQRRQGVNQATMLQAQQVKQATTGVQQQEQGEKISLRERKKQERQISQNAVEEKNEFTKTNQIYQRWHEKLKIDKNGKTLMTDEEVKEEQDDNNTMTIQDSNIKQEKTERTTEKRLQQQRTKDGSILTKSPTKQQDDIALDESSDEELDSGIVIQVEVHNIIRVSSKERLRWDIYIIIAAIYNTITIPLDIAFKLDFLSSIYVTTLESFIDLSFFIDIFLNFRTSYISTKTGEEIKDPKMIAKKYIFGWRFWLDILSSIPFDKLAGESNDILPILGMLKLFRVTRINAVIRNLNIKSDTKAFFKVLWLICSLFLINHAIACLWYYVIVKDQMYVPNKDLPFGGTIYIYELYSAGELRRYLICFYIAFYLISLGETTPRSNLELITAFIIMVICAFLLANIFGQMAVLTKEMNAKTIKFQEQLDTVNTAMKNLNLPVWLKRQVKEFFINTQARQDQQEELNNFLSNISPSLKLRATIQIFRGVLEENPVFETLLMNYNEDQVLDFVIKRFEVELTTPEYAFVTQEEELTDENMNMFFIAKGDCNVMVKDKIGDIIEETKARTLNPGAHFGEISLIYNCTRTATVVANNYCTLAKLTKNNYEELVQKYPELIQRFKEMIFRYNDNVKLFLEKAFDQIQYFKYLSHAVKHEIIYKMKRQHFEKGGYLFKIGDIATQMFIIQSGVVEIMHTVENEPFVIEKLYRESIMNNHSFLLADENDANAKCMTTVSAFVLDFEDLTQIRMRHHDLDQEIKKIESDMLDREANIALDYIIKVPRDKRQQRPFEVENRRNALTLKLKNAVMQKWLAVKESRKKPTIKEILNMVLKKKREDQKRQEQGFSLDQDEKDKLKKKKRMQKEEEEKRRQQEEAENIQSYLTQNQYNNLYTALQQMNEKIHQNGSIIDFLERKLLEILKIKEEKLKSKITPQ